MNNHRNRSQFLIRFGYFGNLFHGVQPQKNMATVGESLYQHILQAADTPPRALQFSARTDKGVHALMNSATCWFKEPFPAAQFIEAMRCLKTPGLFAVRAEVVPTFVHARGSARGKHYRYVIEDNSENLSSNPFAWQIVPRLDVCCMQNAAQHWIGQHDFAAFRINGCSANSTIKHLYHVRVSRVLQSNQIHIDIIGDSFLRQMIRLMVGALVEIGAGFRATNDALFILQAKQQKRVGIVAPAHGLTLMQVVLDIPSNQQELLHFFKKPG